MPNFISYQFISFYFMFRSLFSICLFLTNQALVKIREKLQFYVNGNELLKQNFAEIEDKIVQLRLIVLNKKKQRDVVKSEKNEIKIKQGFSHNELLINDFEERKNTILNSIDQVQDLQDRHQSLSLLVASYPPVPQGFPPHFSSSSLLRGGSAGD